MPMPSATQVVNALRRRGLTVITPPGFERHNRHHVNSRWGPNLLGVATHHTAGALLRGAAARSYAGPGGLLWRGTAELGGPLCQISLDGDGIVHMTGWGRANHAGAVDPRALQLLTSGGLPGRGNYQPGPDVVDGNSVLVGIETMTSAPFTAAQRRSTLLIVAAFHDIEGWPASTPRLLGHRELTRRKPSDPLMDVGAMRTDITALLRQGTPSQGGPSVPAPAPKEWDEMASKAEIEQVMRGVVRDVVREELGRTSLGDVNEPPTYVSPEDRKRNPKWFGSAFWRATLEKVDDTLIVSRRVEAKLDRLLKGGAR